MEKINTGVTNSRRLFTAQKTESSGGSKKNTPESGGQHDAIGTKVAAIAPNPLISSAQISAAEKSQVNFVKSSADTNSPAADDEVVEIRAVEIPKVLLTMMKGQTSVEAVEVKRPEGFILSEEDIFKIKTYVREGLGLPQTAEGVNSYLNLDVPITVEGLTASELAELFQGIKQNSNSWASIENSLTTQATDLSTYASGTIIPSGGVVIETLDALDILIKALYKPGDDLSQVELSEDVKTVLNAIPELINDIKQPTIEKTAKAEALKKEINDFKDEITQLEASTKAKNDLAKTVFTDEKIQQLQEQIDELDLEIDQLKKDYKKYVGLAFTGTAGVVGGPVGLVVGLSITGGIYGDKAEKARKEKNKLIDERSKKADELSRDLSIRQELERLTTKFKDLDIRLLDAISGTGNLSLTWTQTTSYLEAASDKIKEINNVSSYLSFSSEFKAFVKSWESAGSFANELGIILNAVIDDFKKEAVKSTKQMKLLAQPEALKEMRIQNKKQLKSLSLTAQAGKMGVSTQDFKASLRTINVEAEENSALSSLNEKAVRLKHYTSDVEKMLNDNLVAINTATQTARAQELAVTATLEQLNALIQSDRFESISEEDKSKITAQKREFEKKLEASWAPVNSAYDNFHSEVQRLRMNLSSMDFDPQGESTAQASFLTERSDVYKKEIDSLRKEIEDLKSQRETVIAAMDIIRNEAPIDVSHIVPTIDPKGAVKDPEAEAAKAAIETATKILQEGINAQVTAWHYGELLNARETLTKQINEKMAKESKTIQTIDKLEIQISEINSKIGLNQHKENVSGYTRQIDDAIGELVSKKDGREIKAYVQDYFEGNV